MKNSALFAALLCPFCVGCASTLQISDGQNAISGVPFNAPALYVKEFDRNRHSEFGEHCTLSHVIQTVSLPLGQRYYANVNPAQFAKTAFSITFSDNGLLSGITLNTEPAAADTLRAATEAVTALAPLVGLADARAETNAPPLPACDAGEVNARYTEFSEWRRTHGG